MLHLPKNAIGASRTGLAAVLRTGAADISRSEAFSDGVLAIVITLLVLEIKVPQALPNDEAAPWRAIAGQLPMIRAWVVSFLFVLVFWVSHHYFFDMPKKVDRGLLWLNGLFLLAICFMPFPTALSGSVSGVASGDASLERNHVRDRARLFGHALVRDLSCRSCGEGGCPSRQSAVQARSDVSISSISPALRWRSSIRLLRSPFKSSCRCCSSFRDEAYQRMGTLMEGRTHERKANLPCHRSRRR